MARNEKCGDYITFKTCTHGSQCLSRRRGDKTWENEYFLGEIVKIFGDRFKIRRFRENETTEESFFVGGRSWYNQEATEQQLVVFQASEREKNNVKWGRVVLILGNAEASLHPQCDVRIADEVEGFTLYPGTADAYWDAFSVTECTENHVECKKLGIHILATAWCINEPLKKIPPFGSSKLSVFNRILEQRNKNLSKFTSFKKGSRALAISVYIHTNDTKHADGPVFTPVYITENFTFTEFSENRQDDLMLLCSIFKSDGLQKISKTKHIWHLVVEEKTYQTRFFLDDALGAHVGQISKYFRSDISEYAFASHRIVHPCETLVKELTNGTVSHANENNEYLVADYHVTKARSKETAREAAKLLTCSLQIMTFRETMKEMFKMKRFSTEIVKGHGADKDRSFCIFGQKGAPFFVNQQILIQSMIGVPSTLYKEEDLFGINVSRFPEPTLSKCLVRKDDPENLHINHIEVLGTDETLMKLPYSEMGASSGSPKDNEKVQLIWENFHCDEMEYDRVFRVTNEDVRKCLFKLRTSQDPASSLSHLEQDKIEPPFNISSGRLRFTPVPGMIVRIQICDLAPYRSTQVGFRMIRVGRNGHICLAHMNSPQKMFSVENGELKILPTIKNLSETFKIKKIHPTESGRVIRWKGKYNSGGWFKTELPVKKGQLLCIRKDIYEDDKVKYVWNAHGVVDEDQTDDGEVSFSVCTLSQPGETDESDDFVIEYIDVVCE